MQNKRKKSLLPLTEPHKAAQCRGSAHAKYSACIMVIKPFLLLSLAAECRSRQWVWSTVVQPSEVYDIYRWTKLAAPETISHSRDMAGAHQNL